jgi:hypothetical protein
MRRLRGGALGGIFSDSIRLSHSRLWIARKNSIGACKHHLRLGCPFLAQRRDVSVCVLCCPKNKCESQRPFTIDLFLARFLVLAWSLRPLWPSQEDRQASLVDPQCFHHTHIHTDNHPSSGANYHHHQQPPGYNTDSQSSNTATVGYENVTVGVSGIRPSVPALLLPAPWGTLSVAD